MLFFLSRPKCGGAKAKASDRQAKVNVTIVVGIKILALCHLPAVKNGPATPCVKKMKVIISTLLLASTDSGCDLKCSFQSHSHISEKDNSETMRENRQTI